MLFYLLIEKGPEVAIEKKNVMYKHEDLLLHIKNPYRNFFDLDCNAMH